MFGGLLLAAGIGLVRAVGGRPRLGPGSRVMVIGDSLAMGLQPHLNRLANEASVPFFGMAVSGSVIPQWAKSQRMRERATEFEPTIVLVSLGTNDAYLNVEWDEERAAFETLIEALEDTGASIVWVGPPTLPPTYAGKSVNIDFLDELATSAPHYFHSETVEIPRGPDQLHPTAAGYAGWAGTLWNWLS